MSLSCENGMPLSSKDHDTGAKMETLGPKSASREGASPSQDTKPGGKFAAKCHFERRQLVLYLRLLYFIII